jgi:CheY-like chemotaxis protein
MQGSPPKTVVVADDTAFVRDRFKAAIETAGHRALTVKSAAELLARVRADLNVLDRIVLDLRLPHASGVEVVRATSARWTKGACPFSSSAALSRARKRCAIRRRSA